MIPQWLKKLDEIISGWCVNHSHNIADLRWYARLRVPKPMFNYMDGAADSEATLSRNQSDFARYDLLPRYLINVENIDTSTTIMGEKIDFPIVCAPTGMSRLFNNEGELAVSAAVAEAGTIYSLSTMSTHSIEEVASHTTGAKWFQLYAFKDRALVSELIERSRNAGYKGLCLTIDVPVAGNRERDLYSGMAIPPKLTLSSWFSFFLHPIWSIKYLLSDEFQLANVIHKAPVSGDSATTLVGYLNEQFDPTISWDDAAEILKLWDGPFALKGICCVEDAIRAADMGATAVILSNHGGRQLDHSISPITLLPEVVSAVGGRVEIIVDGGIRRGTDVLKALALGATACMIGRPYLFGLGAGGQKGVAKALSILRSEFTRDMALSGCRSIEEINSGLVRER
jgi:L-lactate dehydrogenase (cytochrome)